MVNPNLREADPEGMGSLRKSVVHLVKFGLAVKYSKLGEMGREVWGGFSKTLGKLVSSKYIIHYSNKKSQRAWLLKKS